MRIAAVKDFQEVEVKVTKAKDGSERVKTVPIETKGNKKRKRNQDYGLAGASSQPSAPPPDAPLLDVDMDGAGDWNEALFESEGVGSSEGKVCCFHGDREIVSVY